MAEKPTYEELKQRVKELEKEALKRKCAEDALQFERAQLFSIFDSINEIIYVSDPRTHEIVYVNKALRASFQKSLVGGTCYKEFQGLESPCDFCTNEIILKEKGKPYQWEYHNPILDQDFLITDRIIRWPDGRDVRFEIAINISARKGAEKALRESEEKVRDIFQNVSDFLYTHDLEGYFTETNLALKTEFGYRDEDLVNMNVKDLISERYKHQFKDYLKEVIAKGKSEGLMRVMTKDGRERIIEYKNSLVYDPTGPIGVRGSARDMTERQQVEKRLRKSEERYRLLAENITDVIWTMDQNFNLTYISPSVSRYLGFSVEEAMALPMEERFTPASYELAMKKLVQELSLEESGKKSPVRSPATVEVEFYKKDGSTIWAETNITGFRDREGKVVGLLGVARDISERRLAEKEKKKLETQLRRAQKMESIGTLAGGIAHDFNNILSSIIGYTELTLEDVERGTGQYYNLKEVLVAGKRATDLVKQILAFSRQSEQKKKPVHISLIVKEALELLRASLPTTIEIRRHIEPNTDIVAADSTQIHQVVMNLCTNAHHAMGEEGGILEVSLEAVNLDAPAVAKYADMSPGFYLRLSVSDTGPGMIPEVTERIFDPYFTTKEKGEGTGLGLAVVHGIVKDHDGAITVYSESGKGTTFHVYLPVIEKTVAPDKETVELLPTGQEHILFIDDEQALVDIGRQMLAKLGYDVVTRTSGIEALELFKARPDRFDLVITDMTMPQMTGDKLAKELMQIRPDIPIILCTGYSQHISEEKANGMGIKAFAMKPLVMQDLARTVRKVLGNGD